MDDWDLDDPTTIVGNVFRHHPWNDARPSHREADPDPYIHRATHGESVMI